MSYDEALDIVGRYAHRAGFRPVGISRFEGTVPPPDGAKLWTSTYAQLLVLNCPSSEKEELIKYARIGQEWIDVSCMNSERGDNYVVDGYLLIVLPAKPSVELWPTIRAIELDPLACRKHLAWPEDGLNPELRWLRIFRVTSLGIPSSPLATGMKGSPKLGSEVERKIVEDLKAARSAKKVAAQHAGAT